MNDNHEPIAVFLNAASFTFKHRTKFSNRQENLKLKFIKKLKFKFQMNIK